MEEKGVRQGTTSDAAEIAESFGAFMTSLSQGKELKYLRRDLEDHRKKLDEMRAQLRDMREILGHFDTISVALYDAIEGGEKTLSAARARVQQAGETADRFRDQLKTMEVEHAQALGPQSDFLYAANTELAEAQARLKEAKAQLSAARKEAKAGDASTEPAEGLARAQAAYDAAAARRDEAREVQAEAQRAYDAKAKMFERAENAVKDDIASLEKERQQAEGEAQAAEKKLATAKERLAYCEHVNDNPGEADALEASIGAAEADEESMLAAIAELEERHEESKGSSTLARNIVVALAGIVAFVLIGTLVMHFVL